MELPKFEGMTNRLYIRCVGCGITCIAEFLQPKHVISAPQVACSDECLLEWTTSMKAFIERQVTDA